MTTPSAGRRAFLSGRVRTSSAGLAQARLEQSLSGEVFFDLPSRGRYATDASIYQIMPLGVVVPQTAAEARIALDIARDLGLPVLPRGAGTSQCGQTVGEALVIDQTKYLNQLLHLDVAGRTAVVAPGMVLDDLNKLLKPHGLWFPVDVSTSAQATIGGMAGNNSCGSRSLRYGNMVHHVAGIDAVLADGTQAYFGRFGHRGDMTLNSARMNQLIPEIFQIADRVKNSFPEHWPQVLRRVGGYNLDIFNPQGPRPYLDQPPHEAVNFAQLLVGSEGTLAYFESIKLKLSPRPVHQVLGVVNFPTFEQAMQHTQAIVGLGPDAVELVDRTMLDLARANPLFVSVIERALTRVQGSETQALLLVEFSGDDAHQTAGKLDDLESLMADLGLAGSLVRLDQPQAQADLWAVRKAGLNIMMSLKGDGKPVSFIEDCAVPLAHLADYTAALTEIFERHGTKGTWYAHASVGTLHVRPILDLRREGAKKMRLIADEAAHWVRQFKGAYSGEHGDGLVRSERVAWQFGPAITGAFERLKDAFDPDGRMNPGKIVRAGPMDDASRFRYRPDYTVMAMTPGLDWSAWDVQNDPARPGRTDDFGIYISAPGTGDDPSKGFSKAIEMCNNNGHCRSFNAEVMCPSFRVTRDEQHSVRGRANTLRLALSHQLGGAAWETEAVREAIDLCVGCKACKRECPTGVDMAAMKIEALHQYGRVQGFSPRARRIAALPQTLKRFSETPGLSTLLRLFGRWPLLRRLAERYVGISARRPVPILSQPSFAKTAREGVKAQAVATPFVSLLDCDVVLWADCFSNSFFSPSLKAALSVMQGLGFKVALSGAAAATPLCCGRTALSVGMLDQAKQTAHESLQALKPALDRGVPVVGLEPSCLLSMRDEWPRMGLGPLAAQLADTALLFEEWWLGHGLPRARLQAGPAQSAAGRQVWVHGHCHQKALGALSPTLEALRSVGYRPELIQTGCCGMAGSFGYEAEHFDLSRLMAQDRLLPALEALPKEAWLVADGCSCRHQILDFAGRESLHAAEVIEKALAVG